MTIQCSEQLNELFAALSIVQGKLEVAKKDNKGYNYKYADLGQYIELSKELLADNGLCVLQMPDALEIVEVTKEIYDKKDNAYSLQQLNMPKQKMTTWIGHKSGQFISGSMEMLVERMAGNSWGQSTGSAITYMRRYALSAMLGMAQEDDDNQIPKKESEKTYAKASPIKQDKVNKQMIDHLKELLSNDPSRLAGILKWANVRNVEEMSVASYNAAIDILAKEKEALPAPNKNDTKLVTANQRLSLLSLVSTERLNKILKDYNLAKLDELTIGDYNTIYDELRLETTTKQIENDNLNIKKVS